jgi:Ca2+-binding RTX toxin-like protein
LFGDAGNDTMLGGAGADRHEGGAGVDTVDYSASPSPGTYVDPSTGWSLSGVYAHLVWAPGYGDAAGDRFIGIENLVGSAFDDWLIGNDADNRLVGNNGNDVIDGRGGNDTLAGGAGEDSLGGGSGNDVLIGGAGGDSLDGGSGIDTVDYSAAISPGTLEAYGGVSGVWLDLSVGSGTFGETAGDTYNDIENVIGSAYNDIIGGGVEDNTILGNNGNDVIDGFAGRDTLDGGNGIDSLTYWGSDAAVRVDLAANTASGGHADGDSIAGFEHLTGSFMNDTLLGSDGDNYIRGIDGNDVIDGRDGNDTLQGDFAPGVLSGGADFLSGGLGDDSLIGGLYSDTLSGGTGADTFVIDNTYGNDVILDFNVSQDSLQFDILSLAELEFTQIGGHTRITFDAYEGSIVLLGVDTDVLLAQGDLVFS